jgi:carbonic anhydrase
MSEKDVLMDAQRSFERLQEGNRRFVANVRGADAILSQVRRAELVANQNPFAIVLSCSDSRVPAEIVFDQGLGDLFVIRVAGNIVAPSQLGSVEFAVERFQTRLVVVMGHTRCGAIEATLDSLLPPHATQSESVMSIVRRVMPSVKPLVELDPEADRAILARAAVRANIRASANQLRHGSALLERYGHEEGLVILAAEYDLETGTVEFFDDGAPFPITAP